MRALETLQEAAPGTVIMAKAGKYLTFKLDDEDFGFEILKVQEIIGLMRITSVPQTPPSIRGVINLRGKVIPIIDLRIKFGLPSNKATHLACIIVLNVRTAGAVVTMGALIDGVSEVFDLSADQIDSPPSFGQLKAQEYVIGMAKVAQKVIMLLDVNSVLSIEEASNIQLLSQK